MSNARYFTFSLLLFTLVAFAANSILCRLALRSSAIGAVEFTLVRLLSGMLVLLPILFFYRGNGKGANSNAVANTLAATRSNLAPSLALLAYALFFSLAYIELDVATGALVLFPSVQITMIGVSIYQGNRLTVTEWLGFALAFAGLVYLLFPGLSAPPPVPALMMLASGVSWGVYSLLGQRERYPVLSTARNFLYCVPACLLIIVVGLVRSTEGDYAVTPHGLLLAILSGGVASGLGYILWYVSLRRITTTLASIAQLAVPVIAGLGGVIFLHETPSLRLISASVVIIGGIVLTILGKRRPVRQVAVID